MPASAHRVSPLQIEASRNDPTTLSVGALLDLSGILCRLGGRYLTRAHSWLLRRGNARSSTWPHQEFSWIPAF